MTGARQFREAAELCRRVAAIPTSGGHRADRALLVLAEKLDREAIVNHPLTWFDESASHLFRALVGSREKRLCQWFEARFARDLSFRPPLRPIGQIKIFEPRLAVRGLDCMLECGVEFSLLTDAVEDNGPTLVQLAQIPKSLLERTQLGVIERSGRLLSVAGNKGHGRSAIEQRDGSSDLLLADAQFFGDAEVDRLHRS